MPRTVGAPPDSALSWIYQRPSNRFNAGPVERPQNEAPRGSYLARASITVAIGVDLRASLFGLCRVWSIFLGFSGGLIDAVLSEHLLVHAGRRC